MAVYDKNGNALSNIYAVNGTSLNSAYDIDGAVVFGGGIDYNNHTISSLLNISVSNCQGIAIHNNVLFQFRASGTTVTDTVCLFNFTNGADIYRNMTIKADHGDSATFSNEYYAVGDEFPLIYVTADTTPAKIYVNRVSRSSSSLIRTLAFPSSAGYYGAGAFDWENNVCYLVAYKTNSYTSDQGGVNTTVISKWSLSNLTDNGDGTYTPAFIEQYERPFIYVMQGLEYHDGMIWVTSGYGGAESYIYALDPADGTLLYTIDTGTTTEIEGIAFISDTEAVIGFQGGVYKKITFGS